MIKELKTKKSSVSSGSRSLGSSTSMKEQAIKRLADLMAEASYVKLKKLQELATEQLKIKMEIEQAIARDKIIKEEEQKFGKMANQEDLGYKLSEEIAISSE